MVHEFNKDGLSNGYSTSQCELATARAYLIMLNEVQDFDCLAGIRLPVNRFSLTSE